MSAADRWQRVGALFDRALATPAPERQSLVRSSPEPADVQDEVLGAARRRTTTATASSSRRRCSTAGATVGAYRIERILGRGGMGVVYLAHDTRLHRAVALKALPPHLFRDDRMRARLRQEARAAAALSHPSIATVFALEEIGDQIFIASEYLEGRTLARGADGRAARRKRARSRSRARSRRRCKPRTIAASCIAISSRRTSSSPPSGGVKILDFGLAQFDVAAQDLASVTRLTDPGVMAGTPPYMAPEQLLGQPTSARTDQFAFGVLLYEMLTGRHPFGSGGLPTTIAKTLADVSRARRASMASCGAIISRTLEKNPDDRFPSTRGSAGGAGRELLDIARDQHPGQPCVAPGTSGTPATPGTLGTLYWWSTAPTDRGARLLVHGLAGVACAQMDGTLRRADVSRDAGHRDRRRQRASASRGSRRGPIQRSCPRSSPTSAGWCEPPTSHSHSS